MQTNCTMDATAESARPVNISSTITQNECPETRSSAVKEAREDISTAAMTIAITPDEWISSART